MYTKCIAGNTDGKTSQHIDKTSLFFFSQRELAAAVQSKGAILKWKKGFASSQSTPQHCTE